MIYKLQNPKKELENIIKSFWLIDSEDSDTIHVEKIIPDGYPELIFHYKSAYMANISGSWFLQEKSLVAGQIRNHFYVKNTGLAGMFGIKLQPWVLKLFFNLNMDQITDKVVSIEGLNLLKLVPIKDVVTRKTTFEDKVAAVEDLFSSLINTKTRKRSNGQKAVQLIIDSYGEISIKQLIEKTGISERSLERYFKTHIGVSPKFYSRIIRFSNVFNLIQTKDFNWSDITYLAGFYDQSHFIKNFKEFTGEEPSNYGFTEENMANFFLKK